MTRASDPLDIYLLRVLATLLVERSVSRTAVKLNQSQPAISAALKRLREVFNDPLLIRDKGGMVPTERGLALLTSSRIVLEEIDKLFVAPDSFDPATTVQAFKIGSPDFLSVFFLANVVENFHRSAPHAKLVVHSLGPDFDYERALAEGNLDIVIGNWPTPPEQLHLSVILEDELVCLMRKDHPLAMNGLSAEQYLQAAHIVPMPYSISHRGVVETHLASLRLKRKASVVLPFFNMAPYLLANTDLIFTTSRHFAKHYAGFLPLAIVPSPIDFPPMRFYQLWHDRTHQSEGHRWLRSLLSTGGKKILKRDSSH